MIQNEQQYEVAQKQIAELKHTLHIKAMSSVGLLDNLGSSRTQILNQIERLNQQEVVQFEIAQDLAVADAYARFRYFGEYPFARSGSGLTRGFTTDSMRKLSRLMSEARSQDNQRIKALTDSGKIVVLVGENPIQIRERVYGLGMGVNGRFPVVKTSNCRVMGITPQYLWSAVVGLSAPVIVIQCMLRQHKTIIGLSEKDFDGLVRGIDAAHARGCEVILEDWS